MIVLADSCHCALGVLLLMLLVPGLDASGSQAGEISVKYGSGRNVLRGSPELLRQSATRAPLPEYPQSLLQAAKQGLVVIELVVSPVGRVAESQILESFDEKASAAVASAMKGWRFRSQEAIDSGMGVEPCRDCIRINRLAFDFRIEDGKGRVADLAGEAVRKQGYPDPFQRKK